MSDKREPKFWTCDFGAERLYHDTIADAVDDWANGFTEALPEWVEVYGFAPMRLPEPEQLAGLCLEMLHERLDEDYSDPDGRPTEPTKEAAEAELAFIRKVLEEYGQPWACEKVERCTVKVADYYVEHVGTPE